MSHYGNYNLHMYMNLKKLVNRLWHCHSALCNSYKIHRIWLDCHWFLEKKSKDFVVPLKLTLVWYPFLMTNVFFWGDVVLINIYKCIFSTLVEICSFAYSGKFDFIERKKYIKEKHIMYKMAYVAAVYNKNKQKVSIHLNTYWNG